MKKALKINLSGQVFHIDEDAYEKLKKYLDSISSHFSNVEEKKEIIDDIEARISELFLEKLKNKDQVISSKEVEEVIKIMGEPEDIADEDTTESQGKSEDYRRGSGDRYYRRLYRDPDNSVVGGVAAGLAAYFAVDVLLIRILFIVFILAGFGFPLILYIVFWIAIPKAITPAEKLEMRGEKVNVSNLEKKIREEYEDVKENFKKARNSDAARKTEDFFHEFFRVLGVIIIAFFKIIVAIIAIGFIVAGISLIIGLLGLAFFDSFHSGAFYGLRNIDSDLQNYISLFVNPLNGSIIAVSATLVILIPILAIIYGLFKAIFNFKAQDRALGMSSFALWFVALFSTITFTVIEAKNYSESESVSNIIELEGVDNDLQILFSPNKFTDMDYNNNLEIDDRWYYIGDDELIYGEVTMDVESSSGSNYEMKILKSSRGPDNQTAERLAEEINYSFERSGSSLILNPYFMTEIDNNWRLQKVEVIIFVPEGKSIEFDKASARMAEDHVYELRKYSPRDVEENIWIMNNGRLRKVEIE